jgi:hypothetical protein
MKNLSLLSRERIMLRPLLILSALFLSVAPTHAQSSPWNLDELRKTPRVEWLDKDGKLRRLLYDSEP